ncbi:MAG: hypothetical protein Q7T51_01615 [Candidatus Moranbacteria bacterium]|nr:hypothetical protein [Candidatus Moranbacteria bacterium]
MQINKCDICRKTIKKNPGGVHIGLGSTCFFNHVEICPECGKLVLKLLRDNKLIKDENFKDGK